MGRRAGFKALFSALAALWATGAPAQTEGQGLPATGAPEARAETDSRTRDAAPAPGTGGILILDQDGLLFRSQYGQRIQRELERASEALTAENRRIEAQLTAEELRLTEQRQTMSTEDFRPLAEEFDRRVEAIRAEQDGKSRDLTSQAEAAQARFFELAFPVLLEIVQQRGASVLMDNRAVLLSADAVDITAQAIARVNAAIGDGGPDPLIQLDVSATPDAPETPETEDTQAPDQP